MRELVNLVVDLSQLDAPPAPEVRVGEADERTRAWIDDEFGGTWSSEAYAGTNVVAYKDGAPVGFATIGAKGLRFRWLRGLATEPGVGLFGPIGVARSERGRGLGTTLLRRALIELRAAGCTRALVAAVGEERTIAWYRNTVGAVVAERFDVTALVPRRPRVTVMVSGSGTNLQAVLDASERNDLPVDVVAVVSNKANAYALERAQLAGVPAIRSVVWKRKEENRQTYDLRLLDTMREDRPDLVLMLGWMHLLSEPFVREMPNLFNLHPAFLPLDPLQDDVVLPDGTRMAAFRGADAVGDALRAGCDWVGATMHEVTPQTDRGPVLARKPLHVVRGLRQEQVMERLHPIEQRVVATAVKRWIYEWNP